MDNSNDDEIYFVYFLYTTRLYFYRSILFFLFFCSYYDVQIIALSTKLCAIDTTVARGRLIANMVSEPVLTIFIDKYQRTPWLKNLNNVLTLTQGNS